MPIISVVLPIYNIPEEYLTKCVASVCRQTIDDIEIILVNDGSSNNGLTVCNQLSAKDERIIVIDQINSGVSIARNNGLSIAKGEWIAFVDPDDWLEVDYLESMLKWIKEDIDVVICDCNVVEGSNTIRNHFLPATMIGLVENKSVLLGQLVSKVLAGYYPEMIGPGVPWGKLFRTDFLKKFDLKFVPKMVRMQDNIFCLYALHYARAISYTGQNKYNYRMENNSASFKYNPRIISHFEMYYSEVDDFIDSCLAGDVSYKKALNAKILTSINSYLLYYYCHENYVSKQGDSLTSLLREEPYLRALNDIDFSYLSFKEKCFVFMLKTKMISVLKVIYRLKNHSFLQ
ncbi:glycosyltransferase family 2 protein [Klebsiella sp. MISC125]|uniref:glycosyltransferase family 2 protein n=1 Tax=Klebsiella sp. MISC125 TaxID=2755386 RepID=UPI003DA7E1FE